MHIHIKYIYCVYVYERGQLLLNYSAYEEHFVLQVCIVPSTNYWSQRDTADHYTQLLLYLDQRATCNCKPNLCLPNRTLPEKLSALGTFWVEATTFLCHLLVPALTLSHHYKCTSSFQLPDFSSQPSASRYACFCEPFSLQSALPQKTLPRQLSSHPIYLSRNNRSSNRLSFSGSPCGIWTPPSLQTSPLTLSWTHSCFQQAAHNPRIIHNSPYFACCPSCLHTQTYIHLLPCKRAVMSSCLLTVPPSSLLPKLLFCHYV